MCPHIQCEPSRAPDRGRGHGTALTLRLCRGSAARGRPCVLCFLCAPRIFVCPNRNRRRLSDLLTLEHISTRHSHLWLSGPLCAAHPDLHAGHGLSAPVKLKGSEVTGVRAPARSSPVAARNLLTHCGLRAAKQLLCEMAEWKGDGGVGELATARPRNMGERHSARPSQPRTERHLVT